MKRAVPKEYRQNLVTVAKAQTWLFFQNEDFIAPYCRVYIDKKTGLIRKSRARESVVYQCITQKYKKNFIIVKHWNGEYYFIRLTPFRPPPTIELFNKFTTADEALEHLIKWYYAKAKPTEIRYKEVYKYNLWLQIKQYFPNIISTLDYYLTPPY